MSSRLKDMMQTGHYLCPLYIYVKFLLKALNNADNYEICKLETALKVNSFIKVKSFDS